MIPFNSITVKEVVTPQITLKAKHTTTLEVTLSEDREFLTVEHLPWGLYAFAKDTETLKEEIIEQLAMLWKEFAQEEFKNLTSDALTIKHQLLKDWEEV